jgi:hypothetical protein
MQMDALSTSSFYATVLSWAFVATNSMRVVAYLSAIKKLLRAEGTADSQSQLTWLLWSAFNLTRALHLFESNHRRINEMILITGGNASLRPNLRRTTRASGYLRAKMLQNARRY